MTTDLLVAIAGLLGALSAAGGVLVAWAGLRTWRAQLRGNTEYDLARRVLRAVLKVRDALAWVRAPFINQGEFMAAVQEAGLDPKHIDFRKDHRPELLVYDRRWKAVTTAQSELQVELLEAEVLWGTRVRELESQLRTPIGELYAVVLQHVREKEHPRPMTAKDEDRLDRNFKTMYMTGTDDEFAAKVTVAVDCFQAFLKPRLHITQV